MFLDMGPDVGAELDREVSIPDRKVCVSPDKISSTNPRAIDDQRARQLCVDVRHSLFYETCATYGFNVDRVFSEGGCSGAGPSLPVT